MIQLLPGISIEQLPKRRAKHTLRINDRQPKGIVIYDLMRLIVYPNLTPDLTDADEARQQRRLNHKEITSQTPDSNIHILKGLAENIDRKLIVPMVLEEIDRFLGEALIVPIVELHAGLVNDQLPILDHMNTQVTTGVNLI